MHWLLCLTVKVPTSRPDLPALRHMPVPQVSPPTATLSLLASNRLPVFLQPPKPRSSSGPPAPPVCSLLPGTLFLCLELVLPKSVLTASVPSCHPWERCLHVGTMSLVPLDCKCLPTGDCKTPRLPPCPGQPFPWRVPDTCRVHGNAGH